MKPREFFIGYWKSIGAGNLNLLHKLFVTFFLTALIPVRLQVSEACTLVDSLCGYLANQPRVGYPLSVHVYNFFNYRFNNGLWVDAFADVLLPWLLSIIVVIFALVSTGVYLSQRKQSR